ncbi:MAG: amidohydrolase [Planctomycetes bacterium]|nr:amidohydrolase [Planctomycetota bacterium]
MPYAARYAIALLVSCLPFIATAPHAEDKISTASPVLKERVAAVDKIVGSEISSLVELYKDLHSNPELSLKEEKTSAKMAKELEKLGFEVTKNVGGEGVHGVVGVLKNGAGPTILVRTDMDGLPVIEQTGMPYASKVTTRDKYGREVGVMHACGHDIHMSCWVGTARVLVGLKDKWSGTLVFIAQPAEEIGFGAKAMLKDGLYTRFPKPDYCLALHTEAQVEAGHIAFTDGLSMANVDTIDILVKGRGGHGSAPHLSIDPVVLACKIVIDLQTIVSRERNPVEPAVVTVGSIHGGNKHNIIPNEVKLQLTVRTTTDSGRKQVIDSIHRISKAAALSMRAPEPEITHSIDNFTPKVLNETKLTRKTIAVFKEVLGEDKIHERPPVMGGEDFSRYAIGGEVPIFLYFLGTIDSDRYSASRRENAPSLPAWHSDNYYPAPTPSITTGVKTMSLAVLNLVGK